MQPQTIIEPPVLQMAVDTNVSPDVLQQFEPKVSHLDPSLHKTLLSWLQFFPPDTSSF